VEGGSFIIIIFFKPSVKKIKNIIIIIITDDNYVVMVTGLSRTSSANTLSRSPASDSDSHDATVDTVYRQATDFISFTEQLKRELSDEQNQQKRLHDACVQVTECLESMKRTVSDLRSRAAATAAAGDSAS